MEELPIAIVEPNDCFTEEDYKKLSFEELIEHNLKKDRIIRKLKNKIVKLTESKAEIKFNYDQMCKRIIEHRKQLSYKDGTLTLYKRILEKLCLHPTDEK